MDFRGTAGHSSPAIDGPDHLGHTGFGTDSIKILSESVGIRLDKDNEVELVFTHDRDFGPRGLWKFERNVGY